VSETPIPSEYVVKVLVGPQRGGLGYVATNGFHGVVAFGESELEAVRNCLQGVLDWMSQSLNPDFERP
jgi:hypothetical protein